MKMAEKAPKPDHPGLALFKVTSAGKKLEAGDCIKMFDGSFHIVKYVNDSGAYVASLSSSTRDIKGHTIEFTRGGRMISARSIVEAVNPRTMGVNSPEYARYVRMYRALVEEGMAKRITRKSPTGEGNPEAEAAVALLDSFDNTPIDTDDPDMGLMDGDEATANPTKKELSMAKKAAAKVAKANGKVKSAAKAKGPKVLKPCVCTCGGQTASYFCPGHDARMHGWIKKLAEGTIEPKDVPKAVVNKLQLVATAKGHKATKPHFWQDAE
jgi:hypothetical protein